MSDHPIQNCEGRFRFKCPNQWEELGRTDDPGVRSCGQCQKFVYLCQSESELVSHARRGHCIAAPTKVLTARKRLDGPERAAVLAAQDGASVSSLRELSVDSDLLRLVPVEVARKHLLIPMARKGDHLVMAMSDPSPLIIDDITFLTGHPVDVVVASRKDIEEALDRNYPDHSRMTVDVGVIFVEEEEVLDRTGWDESWARKPLLLPGTPVKEDESVTLVGYIIEDMLLTAHQMKAERIRIEATDSDLVIHYLVEGASRDSTPVLLTLREELLSKLRERSGARADQPGRLQLQVPSVSYEVHFHSTERGEEVGIHRLPKAD